MRDYTIKCDGCGEEFHKKPIPAVGQEVIMGHCFCPIHFDLCTCCFVTVRDFLKENRDLLIEKRAEVKREVAENMARNLD